MSRCSRAVAAAWLLCLCFEQNLCVSIDDTFFSFDPILELYAPLKTENSQCYVETLYFRNATKKRAPWALQMLDASSKLPSSLLAGNVIDLGNFDQCLAVRSDGPGAHTHVVGKYCLVKAVFNRTWNEHQPVTLKDLTEKWTWSVCIPAVCTAKDLIHHLKLSLEDMAEEINEVDCTSSLDDAGLSLKSQLMIFFIVALIFTVFAATWIEYQSMNIPHQLTKSVVASFSLMTNGKLLLSNTPPGRMIDSLQGIRVISTLTILSFHRAIYFIIIPSVNHADIPRKLTHNMLELLVLNGTLAVDVFFLMGGTVLAYGFIRERKARLPFSFFKHVLYRYLRITPAYFFVILIYMTVFYDIGSGPLWDFFIGFQKKNCLNNWWTNILYINNYWNSNEFESCMGYTWYLGADMQFYVVAPLFLFLLLKNRKCGVFLIVVTCLVSGIYSFWITYIKDYPWTFTVDYNVLKRSRFQVELYFPAHARLPPFFLGLLLGYLLDHYRKEKMKMSFWLRMFGWTIAVIVMLTVPYGLTYYYWFGSGPLLSALYASLHRPLFVTSIAWIIFNCDQGYGGPINTFLSQHFFQVLSRLTFCFYLVHCTCMHYDFGTKRSAIYFSYFKMFQAVASDVIILLPCSAALSLTLEHPFIHLNKLIFKKNPTKVSKLEHPVQATEGPWVINGLDQISTAHTSTSSIAASNKTSS